MRLPAIRCSTRSTPASSLQERGVALGRPATLDDVRGRVPRRRSPTQGFDWVWFLGVWQTGRGGPRRSRASNPKLVEECRRDAARSARRGHQRLAVRDRGLHASTDDFGGDAALARLRERLTRRGAEAAARLRAQPHGARPPVGHDPPGVLRARQRGGSRARAAELRARRAGGGRPRRSWRSGAIRTSTAGRTRSSSTTGTAASARRRSPSWARSPTAATASAATWRCCCSRRSSSAPGATARARRRLAAQGRSVLARGDRARSSGGTREFLFIAEVYWDMEWELQQAGFDYTYDKRLYDRLVAGAATPVREHLWPTPRSRIARCASSRTTTSRARPRRSRRPMHRAAAVIALLARGLRFFHEGELEGRRSHVSMHLGRRPVEPVDTGSARVLRAPARVPAAPGGCTTASGGWRDLPARPGPATRRTSSSSCRRGSRASSGAARGQLRPVAGAGLRGRRDVGAARAARSRSSICWATRATRARRRPRRTAPVPRHARVGDQHLRPRSVAVGQNTSHK